MIPVVHTERRRVSGTVRFPPPRARDGTARKRAPDVAFWLMSLLAALLILLSAIPARAAPPELVLPLACAPNRDCWVANHVDHDPGPGVRDYHCGTLTYEAHNGTDFALRDLAAMQEGVAVLAAAAGRVRSLRDGVADVSVRDIGKDAVKDRECGNGVVIEHGEGWETQYCHLHRGSVRVKAGEQVAAGQTLGRVGLSGLTEYPHLHLSVRHNGKTVDPFSGEGSEGTAAACQGGVPLWRADTAAQLPYAPGAVYNVGFASEPPEEAAVRAGRYRQAGPLRADAPVIVFYAEVFGVAAGDVLEIRISGPQGAALAVQRFAIERAQARRYAYLGAHRPAAGWQPGVYRGEARLIHADGTVSPASTQSASAEVAPQ